MITAIQGMPSLVAADPGMADAWTDGSNDAGRAYRRADAYREMFNLEATYVPAAHRDGGEREDAYREGYMVRALDLTDGEWA